jgi:citronellyl-CoA dehydrogenase
MALPGRTKDFDQFRYDDGLCRQFAAEQSGVSSARAATDTAVANACVRKRVKGEDATREITMAKLFVGRMCRFVSDTCIQLHGGFGYMRESAAGRAYVDMRLISIGGGADEVMIQYLAKMLGF